VSVKYVITEYYGRILSLYLKIMGADLSPNTSSPDCELWWVCHQGSAETLAVTVRFIFSALFTASIMCII
jgi:hypothetical protein